MTLPKEVSEAIWNLCVAELRSAEGREFRTVEARDALESAILAALTEAREGALREARVPLAPPWIVFRRGDGTADVLPAGRPGAVLECLPVALAEEIADAGNRPRGGVWPVAAPRPASEKRCSHGFPLGHLQHVSDATDVVHEADGCYTLDQYRIPVSPPSPSPAPAEERCQFCNGTGYLYGGERCDACEPWGQSPTRTEEDR